MRRHYMLMRPVQVMYYTAQWTWTRRINRIELFNEPELELCWDSDTFVQQTMIRCTHHAHPECCTLASQIPCRRLCIP